MRGAAGEADPAPGVGLGERIEKVPPEQAGEDLDGARNFAMSVVRSPKAAAMVRNASCAIRNRVSMAALRFAKAMSATLRGQVNTPRKCRMGMMLPAPAPTHFHAALPLQVGRCRFRHKLRGELSREASVLPVACA